jgi:Domain of unknown function (DUF4386)
MQAITVEQSTGEVARWLRFLSRWALVTVFMVLALLLVYLGGIGFAPSDNALGAEYSELLQAVRAPALHRLAMTFDASGWLTMGGTLLTLAIILSRHTPIRAMLIAACGMGLLVGVVGGGIRLVGISGLAAQYASSAPAQQAALLSPTLALYEMFSALFVVGDVLAGAAFLLVASAAWGLPVFPRWLTGWLVLAGVLSLLQGVTSAVGAFSFPILLLTVVIGILGLHVAIAVAFWRVAPVSLAATLSTSAR